MERVGRPGTRAPGEFARAISGVGHRSLVFLGRGARYLKETLRGESPSRQLLACDAGLFRYGRKEMCGVHGFAARSGDFLGTLTQVREGRLASATDDDVGFCHGADATMTIDGGSGASLRRDWPAAWRPARDPTVPRLSSPSHASALVPLGASKTASGSSSRGALDSTVSALVTRAMRSAGIIALAGILAAAASTGCAPIDRARQCETLAETVNPSLEKIEALSASMREETRIATLDTIADTYDELAERVKTLASSDSADSKLEPVMRDMGRLFVRTANTTRALITSVEKDKLSSLRSASRRLERQTREHNKLLKRARRICKTK